MRDEVGRADDPGERRRGGEHRPGRVGAVRQHAEDRTCGEAHGGAGRQHDPGLTQRYATLLEEGGEERRLEAEGAEQGRVGGGEGGEELRHTRSVPDLAVPTNLTDEFAKPSAGNGEGLSAVIRHRVAPSPASARSALVLARHEVACLLHGVQHGVERSRAELVPVPGQLLDHPLPVDLAFGGMVEDVQAHEAGQEVVMIHGRVATRSRFREHP